MKLCCAKKGCAHVSEHPNLSRGFHEIQCPQCQNISLHFPQPATKPAQVKGHRGIFDRYMQFTTRRT